MPITQQPGLRYCRKVTSFPEHWQFFEFGSQGKPGASPATELTYHTDMARGWESKSVEEQQASADLAASSAEGRRKNDLERAQRERQRQELDLQRERILSERTSSPVRRAALEAALADIESRLALLS